MNQDPIRHRFELFMSPDDGRYEQLIGRRRIFRYIRKDITAGLLSAAVMIPLAMGFAMASGLRPEQGIAGGAVAALLGALFGGSKYQVYGPSAALIPVIGGIMTVYNTGFLALASFIAGVFLLIAGLFKAGRMTEKIPRSIAIGLTFGIVLIIAFSQIKDATGLKEDAGFCFTDQLRFLNDHRSALNIAAISMTICTVVLCQAFLKISRFIPGPFIALAFGYFGAKTFWTDKGLQLIEDKYSSMSGGFFAFVSTKITAQWDLQTIISLLYYSLSIFIVVIIESTSSGRRADRLADNSGQPFDPHKELWGNGIINIFSPVLNGLPVCGTWTGTSVNTRAGAQSPLAGIVRFVVLLLLAGFLVIFIEKVPLSCIAGILLWVALNKIKKWEIKEIIRLGKYHWILAIVTGILVLVLGFLPAVISSISIYILFRKRFARKTAPVKARRKEIAL
ncbi:MAG: SulP family inorganic anion transporter [Chitinophagaceae bacterium]|nr:SulP family inorganic anion transporter [Chitinophagaceae bacterium]